MSPVSRPWNLVASLVFLALVPGSVVGLVPYWLTGWQVEEPFPGASALRAPGALLVLAGLASLLDSIARFALVGLGTPAPVAPPTRLVVSGPYRHVRNPMYVAVVALVAGQGLVLGSGALLLYAALLWLLFHSFVVLYEEPRLASRFGGPYEEYRRNVGRWWPRIRPWAG